MATRDGTQPSALREAVLAIDKDLKIDAMGLPACGYRTVARRETKQVRRRCRKAIVGKGEAKIHVAYPENSPITLSSEITVVNGGERAGETTLLAHAFITVPIPRAIVVPIKISPKGTGWIAMAKIPRMTDGYGSLVEVRLSLRRPFFDHGRPMSLFSAKCPDGVFRVKMPKALFKNEARVPGVATQTVLRGSLAVPCKPEG